jgi:hypothetical protein
MNCEAETRLPADRCVVMPRMRGPLRLILPLFALLLLLALPGGAAAADKPSKKTLYYEGPSGRYLMDGTWLFRRDAGNKGWAAAGTGARAPPAGAGSGRRTCGTSGTTRTRR